MAHDISWNIMALEKSFLLHNIGMIQFDHNFV